jgi:integrase
MRLTDLTIRSLALPLKGQKLYYDDTLPSFGCRVSQGGTRSFFVQVGADRQFITIGRYHPDILPLAKARAEAKRILAERVLGKHRPQSIPFDEAKTLFLEACLRKNKARTHYDYSRLLKRHFNFGRAHLADITPSDIQRRLDRVADTPAEQAYAARCIKIFMRWAERRHYLDTSPASRIEARSQSTQRTRVLSDRELKLIWRACDHQEEADEPAPIAAKSRPTPRRGEPKPPPLPATFCTIVKLLILTGQRRGEVAALRKQWISSGTITLPSEITKNGREHTFPIGKLAASVLQSSIEASDGHYLFPARGRSGTSFNGWSKSKAALDRLSGVGDWTLHDLRRTFASNLAALGVQLPVIEKLLNHVSGSFGGIVSVYQRHNFMPEMRDAMQRWEARLVTITGK